MSVDIDPLTEAELIDLNRRVVERLRFLIHDHHFWNSSKLTAKMQYNTQHMICCV